VMIQRVEVYIRKQGREHGSLGNAGL